VKGRAGKPVPTDCPQYGQVQLGISAEPAIKILTKTVMPIDIFEKLEDDTRAKLANTLDMPLAPQTADRD
jgi:hypothetical protein